ncbi:LysM domain-containing protein [Jeotgalicoccus sp. WY2]|uniref:LysM peptidoglycan-binding domain-containing protein n=1 Tax=Jeotgalicoccus sp. WY2 TaxID=2708346 RepID=UPI002110F41D|nr:LysM domain-containing protein [Jeotgalicoccus sp. WY2]
MNGTAKKSTTKYHTVKSGDTVSGLAARYGSTQKQIVNWNKLANANMIYVGQKLKVK